MDWANRLGEKRRFSRAGVDKPVDRFSMADATEKAWDGSSWSSTEKLVDLENSMDRYVVGGSGGAFFCRGGSGPPFFCRVHPVKRASGSGFFSSFAEALLVWRFVAKSPVN